MMTSHNWPEYQLPKTICGDILHHTVKVLSEILHYAVPDHSLWLLQYYGSLACIAEAGRSIRKFDCSPREHARDHE